MAPTACESSEVCCSGVNQCLDKHYNLEEWQGRSPYIILHGTLPTSVQGVRDTHMRLCAIVSCPLSDVIIASGWTKQALQYVILHCTWWSIMYFCTFLMK